MLDLKVDLKVDLKMQVQEGWRFMAREAIEYCRNLRRLG